MRFLNVKATLNDMHSTGWTTTVVLGVAVDVLLVGLLILGIKYIKLKRLPLVERRPLLVDQ